MSDTPQTTVPAFTPVPRLHNRHDGWTPERQRGFIDALALYGLVRAAANAVGMTPEGAYLLRRHPEGEEFRAAWAAALDLGIEKLEDVAMERALNGVEVPVYSYGKLVGTRIKHNDRLVMFMLRNRAPGRFAEGKPKALNALDRQPPARFKRQWREEWERERALAADRDEQATVHSISDKLRAAQANRLNLMSDATRAAWEHFQACEAEDKASGYAHMMDRARRPAPDDADEAPAPELPAPGEAAPAEESPLTPSLSKGPAIRTLKDGW